MYIELVPEEQASMKTGCLRTNDQKLWTMNHCFRQMCPKATIKNSLVLWNIWPEATIKNNDTASDRRPKIMNSETLPPKTFFTGDPNSMIKNNDQVLSTVATSRKNMPESNDEKKWHCLKPTIKNYELWTIASRQMCPEATNKNNDQVFRWFSEIFAPKQWS